jgi:hypothetical protein
MRICALSSLNLGTANRSVSSECDVVDLAVGHYIQNLMLMQTNTTEEVKMRSTLVNEEKYHVLIYLQV